jgi:hypothetical protein
MPAVYGKLENKLVERLTDPTAEPFLSPTQLRDTLLQDEHSVAVRQEIWKNVEATVKSNSNIQENIQEFNNGAEDKAWQWIGPPDASIAYDAVDSAPLTPA